MMKDSILALADIQDQQYKKLNQIVLEAVEEEKLISGKSNLLDETDRTFQQRLADRIASFAGSWIFMIYFLAIMFCWIVMNAYLLSRPFDPFPFIFLNLLLSTIAALQAPVIMMSQNRKEQKDRQRAVNDYLVNLKAEIEVRNLHRKLDLLISEQMKTLFELQQLQVELMEEIRSDQKKREPL